MILVNIRSCRFCAFCKYWWDPTCKFILPQMGTQWYFEPSGKCPCIKTGAERNANSSCSFYRCKLDI